LEKQKINQPRTVFKYNDVRVKCAYVFLTASMEKPLPVVLKDKIMDPIGASSTWRWYGCENSFVELDGVMMQSVSGGRSFGGGIL
jgi:hypothetical protein